MNVEVIRGIGADLSAPTYIPPNPIDPAAPLPAAAPIPAGYTVAATLEQTDGFDPEKLAEWVGQGAALQEMAAAGNIDMGDFGAFDFKAAFGAMAAGAAVGAAIGGPLGAAAGAIAGLLITVGTFITGQTQSIWDGAGPGVRNYADAFMPSAFIQWAQDNDVHRFQSIPDLIKTLFLWYAQTSGFVITGGAPFYSGIDPWRWINDMGGAGVCAQLYGQIGVDWEATRRLRNDLDPAHSPDRNVLMYGWELKRFRGVGDQLVKVETPANVTPPTSGTTDMLVPIAAATFAVLVLPRLLK